MISAPFFEVSRLQAITFKRAFRFLDGNCLRKNVIYQATVTTGTTTNHTLDSVATNFKEQYRNHLTSFRHANRIEETRRNCPNRCGPSKMPTDPFTCRGKYSVIVNHMTSLAEIVIWASKKNFFIICKKHLCTLNKRNELASSCPYRNRFTLRNFRIT